MTSEWSGSKDAFSSDCYDDHWYANRLPFSDYAKFLFGHIERSKLNLHQSPTASLDCPVTLPKTLTIMRSRRTCSTSVTCELWELSPDIRVRSKSGGIVASKVLLFPVQLHGSTVLFTRLEHCSTNEHSCPETHRFVCRVTSLVGADSVSRLSRAPSKSHSCTTTRTALGGRDLDPLLLNRGAGATFQAHSELRAINGRPLVWAWFLRRTPPSNNIRHGESLHRWTGRREFQTSRPTSLFATLIILGEP